MIPAALTPSPNSRRPPLTRHPLLLLLPQAAEPTSPSPPLGYKEGEEGRNSGFQRMQKFPFVVLNERMEGRARDVQLLFCSRVSFRGGGKEGTVEEAVLTAFARRTKREGAESRTYDNPA